MAGLAAESGWLPEAFGREVSYSFFVCAAQGSSNPLAATVYKLA